MGIGRQNRQSDANGASKTSTKDFSGIIGRGERIRTSGLPVPKSVVLGPMHGVYHVLGTPCRECPGVAVVVRTPSIDSSTRDKNRPRARNGVPSEPGVSIVGTGRPFDSDETCGLNGKFV